MLRFGPDAGADAVSDALFNRSLFSPRRVVQYDVPDCSAPRLPASFSTRPWNMEIRHAGEKRNAFRFTRALLSALDLPAGDPVETAEAVSKKTRRRETADRPRRDPPRAAGGAGQSPSLGARTEGSSSAETRAPSRS